MKNFGVVLAAGKGSRLKISTPKPCLDLLGKPIGRYILESLQAAKLEQIAVIVGHEKDLVRATLNFNAHYFEQKEQLGTGHALLQAYNFLADNFSDNVVVVCADTPLIESDLIANLLNYHQQNNADLTLVATNVANPNGYGRVIINAQNIVEAVIEEKEASEDQKKIKLINSGIYCFRTAKLLKYLATLQKNNNQNEYYLTDLVQIFFANGLKVCSLIHADELALQGVNDLSQFALCRQILRKKIIEKHLLSGVNIIDPSSTFIDIDVRIEAGTIIEPQTIIRGQTTIGKNCQLGFGTFISNCQIAEGSQIWSSRVTDCRIGKNVHIGPYTHLRNSSIIGDEVRLGNFVEVKKSTIGPNSKAAHLAYLGDAIIGKNVNIGCGVITANYDGVKKHVTQIEDDCFIGSNSTLIAPIKIANQAFVAAGSTLTADVEASALAIARARQVNKPGYRHKKK